MSDMNRFVSAYTAIVENATGKAERMLAHLAQLLQKRIASGEQHPIEKMSSPVAAGVGFSFSPVSRAGNTVAPTGAPPP